MFAAACLAYLRILEALPAAIVEGVIGQIVCLVILAPESAHNIVQKLSLQ